MEAELRPWRSSHTARRRIVRTVAASHLPLRAVATPRPFKAAGDLARRLRFCRLSLAYRWHDGVGVGARLGLLRAYQPRTEAARVVDIKWRRALLYQDHLTTLANVEQHKAWVLANCNGPGYLKIGCHNEVGDQYPR